MSVGKKILGALGRVPVWLYRRTNGRIGGTVRGVRILLLTVPGRKTGVPHTVPISFFEHDGAYIVVGSAGGAKQDPQWMRNLRHAPRARIQIGAEQIDVTTRVAAEPERTELWRDVVVSRAPFFAPYERKSGRKIPLGVLRRG